MLLLRKRAKQNIIRSINIAKALAEPHAMKHKLEGNTLIFWGKKCPIKVQYALNTYLCLYVCNFSQQPTIIPMRNFAATRL